MKGPPKQETKSRLRRNDSQRQLILDAASLLFIEKGFGGTNVNDIADAVGVTRTALYYYFPSKESILEALTKGVTEKAGALAKSVSARNAMPPGEALQQLILQHAGLILSHPLQFRVVERSESSLPEPHRSSAAASRRAVLENFVGVVQRGMDAGDFRDANAHMAAFSIIGMCNWCAWWFDPEGDVSAQGVAESIAEFAARALAPEGQATRSSTAEQAVLQMRNALAVMETHLKSISGKPGDKKK